jgi:hypothetical protein
MRNERTMIELKTEVVIGTAKKLMLPILLWSSTKEPDFLAAHLKNTITIIMSYPYYSKKVILLRKLNI